MYYMRKSNTFQFEEDPFSKKAGGIAFIMLEALLLMKFLQAKPQIKNKNINYDDLYYTIIKNLSDDRGEN